MLVKNPTVHNMNAPCKRIILELKEIYAQLIFGPMEYKYGVE